MNKDQLDILATLRESVNEDKAEMEREIKELRDQIKELSDKNRMQLEQINGLLLEKVSLQSEGIDQRDRMLQRERAIGYVIRLTAEGWSSDGALAAISARRCPARTYRKTSSHVSWPCMRRISNTRSS